ncbi:MAG: TRAP transporter fused permease subunit [Holophagales bacterium]|nr:TRAP transporter fused permease subunit [Holophagales bacterium]
MSTSPESTDRAAATGPGRVRPLLVRVLSVILCLFTLAEVNYPLLQPQSQLAIFAMLGLVLAFLLFPAHPRFAGHRLSKVADGLLALATVGVCGYVVVQTEPAFQAYWASGSSLGDRAGAEVPLDHWVGALGLLLVLEAARRSVGFALPLLSILFLAYGHWGQAMPSWLFPHRGYDLERLVGQTFLHSQGVFGVALKVMFTYVFLFVVFGAFLELTGATRFVIEYARRLLGNTAGGPAKVAILSSGLMGSLSGSAVANTATTGTFTIPLMRSSGFRRHQAAGIEAAASSGGALVPPVMGAGAYMMLEIVTPPVTYVEILRAALLPAILYYLSLFLIAHFSAQRLARLGSGSAQDPAEQRREDEENARGRDGKESQRPPPGRLEGLIFFASLGALVALLLSGFSVFRSVTLAMGVTLVLAAFHPRTRLGPKRLIDGLERASRNGIALVAAAASVGVVIGVVTLTGVGSKLPATILPLAEQNLFLALLLIMVSSIVLGMGLPSAVCYLLLATLIGPALGGLGVVPLAAHLFIFYFGLMSMVTPPVALAAYTAASISGSKIMRTAVASFRFALVGFALPFLFVYRPQLLMLAPDGSGASLPAIAISFTIAAFGIVPLAAAIAGFFGRPLGPPLRALLLTIAVMLIFPVSLVTASGLPFSGVNLLGLVLLVATGVFLRRRSEQAPA